MVVRKEKKKQAGKLVNGFSAAEGGEEEGVVTSQLQQH